MSIQPGSFNPFFTQQSTSGPTISSGVASGTVFDGRGHDFLSPQDIMNNVHGFGGSISPIGPGGSVFGKHPNSGHILSTTNASLNNILFGDFGVNLAAPIAANPGFSFSGGMPMAGTTGVLSGGALATNTTVLSRAVQTPSPALIRDLSNFNPLIWHNPNPSNVLLGSMDAQNKIFGGQGLFSPPMFNQYPLYPFIAQPSTPYDYFKIPIPTQGGVNNFQQAQMFPTTFATGSPFFYTQIQPYAVATTQTMMTYQMQVQLLELIMSRSNASSSQMLGTLSPLDPNGILPWI